MPIGAATFQSVLPPFVTCIASASGDVFEHPETGDFGGCHYYPSLSAPGLPPMLDALLFEAENTGVGDFAGLLRRSRLKIHRHGTIYLLIAAAQWREGAYVRAVTDAGLAIYRGWLVEGAELLPWDLEKPVPSGQLLLRFHRAGYDPVLHARAHIQAGDLMIAAAILDDTPRHWLQTETAYGLFSAERLVCQLAQERHSPPSRRLDFLVSALYWYTRACTFAPTYVPAYQCLAAFWRRVGRGDMGYRLLRTVSTILPSPEVDADLARYDSTPLRSEPFRYPAYDPAWRPRILYLSHPESDYAADLLYDGLRRLLGADWVIEYPWKPSLHGQNLEAAGGYPCTFHWPDPARPLADIVRMAGEGAFDVILVSDTLGTLPAADVRDILAAAPDTPRFLVDTWDECGNFQDRIRDSLGLGTLAGYFKREMIAGIDYGPRSWPLLFPYPDDRIPETPCWEGRSGVFFAGKLMGGARRLQLSWLNRHFSIAGGPGVSYTQEEYTAMLQKQSIGLCLFGNGFDTVRYWELPAHGAMLLAERSPLVIPHDFEDGRQAVFFDHAGELKEKLTYYLAHPDEALSIAQAGHAHLLEFHTSTARARQLLGKLRERMRALQTEA